MQSKSPGQTELPESNDVSVVEAHAVENIAKVLKRGVWLSHGKHVHDSKACRPYLSALRGIRQAAIRGGGSTHWRVAATEFVGYGGAAEELDGAGSCQSPKVGLAEVGVAHVDGVEEIADDGQALRQIARIRRGEGAAECY